MIADIITIDTIKLCSGNARYGAGRTVMSETGLPADTQVQFVESKQRQFGGYNSLYRIVGTDDLLTIRHNDGHFGNPQWENVEVTTGYFTDTRTPKQKIEYLAGLYCLPFDVGLALGDKQFVYPYFHAAINNLDDVQISTIRDLHDADINTRKSGLLQALGQDVYNIIGIDTMEQEHIDRLARFVAYKCEQWLA